MARSRWTTHPAVPGARQSTAPSGVPVPPRQAGAFPNGPQGRTEVSEIGAFNVAENSLRTVGAENCVFQLLRVREGELGSQVTFGLQSLNDLWRRDSPDRYEQPTGGPLQREDLERSCSGRGDRCKHLRRDPACLQIPTVRTVVLKGQFPRIWIVGVRRNHDPCTHEPLTDRRIRVTAGTREQPNS